MCACACVCVRACVRVRALVCVYVRVCVCFGSPMSDGIGTLASERDKVVEKEHMLACIGHRCAQTDHREDVMAFPQDVDGSLQTLM